MGERCVLCGNELGFLGKGSVLVYSVDQPVCKDCEKRFRQAQGDQREALLQKILSSPALKYREHVERVRAEVLERQETQRQKERREQALLQARAEKQKDQLMCCGMQMERMGNFRFQMGEHSFFLGDWSHLVEGSMELAMFRCPCCGQIKSFDPDFISEQ